MRTNAFVCFRVMAFVQKAVARLYEPDKLDALLRDLGKKHYGYGAKQNYVDVITYFFSFSIHHSAARLNKKFIFTTKPIFRRIFFYVYIFLFFSPYSSSALSLFRLFNRL